MQRPRLFTHVIGLVAMILATLTFARPSSAQAAPSPASDVKTILVAALAKTAIASAYQLELDVSAKGMPPEAAAMFGNPKPGQEVSLINVAGKRRAKDMDVTLKGGFMAVLGLDPSKSLEFIEAGGKTYIHGPAPMFGAPEDKWYVIDGPSGGASIFDGFQSGFSQSFDYNALKNADLSFIKTIGKEALHGQQCDVYGSNDKNAIAQALKTVATSSLSAADIDQLHTAEVKFWVCDDGYFHQATVAIEGTTPERPNDMVAIHVRMSLFDYNGSFTIAAPPNPAKLEQPKLDGPVVQPAPSPGISPSGADTAIVFNGGNIRQTPNMKGQVLGQLHAHQTVMVQETTIDSRWYYVVAPEAEGWVHASLLRISPDVASRVFVNGEAMLASPLSERLPATVMHSGNRRSGPNMKSEVLGQVHEGQVIQLLARTRNGAWYYARCGCGAYGWVHASLLKVDPKDARKVPIA